MSSPDFHLLSTTRRDPQFLSLSWNTDTNRGQPSPYLLLSYHLDRLVDAAKVHEWCISEKLTLTSLEKLCESALKETASVEGGHCRIRILLSHTGALSVTASPAAPLPMPDPMTASLWLPPPSDEELPVQCSDLLVLHLDTLPTPSSNFTRTKTTRRDHYNAARDRFRIPLPPVPSVLDVILYNKQDDITETTIRNIAFIRRSPPRWVTPATATGCLQGVARRWLLEQTRIVEANEGELKRGDVVDGEYVLTFNGVEGCRLGRVKVGE